MDIPILDDWGTSLLLDHQGDREAYGFGDGFLDGDGHGDGHGDAYPEGYGRPNGDGQGVPLYYIVNSIKMPSI